VAELEVMQMEVRNLRLFSSTSPPPLASHTASSTSQRRRLREEISALHAAMALDVLALETAQDR
jgi:hypothetical protein